jgi:hypothetical protein
MSDEHGWHPAAHRTPDSVAQTEFTHTEFIGATREAEGLPNNTFGPSPGIPPARPGRTWLPVVLALVIAVSASIGAVIALGGSSTPETGVALADFVASAAQTTLTQRTADLVFGGTVTADGQSLPISGSGEALLSYPQRFAATVQFTSPSRGTTLEEKELVADNHFYMDIESGGQDISEFVPGKHWVEIPVPVGTGSNSLGTGTSDPLAQLKLLAAKGNKVTSLGTKPIRGVTASGFAVTISRPNLLKAERQFLSSSGLNAATWQQLAQAAQNLPTPTIDVWFDSSKLLLQLGFATKATENGTNVAVNLVMDFVNYGARVSISVPSPSDVASYSQFVAAADAASGNGE